MKKLYFCIVAIILIVCCSACQKQEEKLNEYELDLFLDVETKTLKGNEKVTFYNDESIIFNELKFELYPNAFRKDAKIKPYYDNEKDRVFTSEQDYGCIDILSVKNGENLLKYGISGEDENILNVSIDELVPGESTTVEIDFEVKLPHCNLRMGYNENSYNLADFYPILCAYEKTDGWYEAVYSPCGDPFYSSCSNYAIAMTVPKECILASSCEIVSKAYENDYTTYNCKISKARNIAFIVYNECNVLTKQSGEVTVNYYYNYDVNPNESLSLGVSALEKFSQMFYAYPYKTFSICETDFSEGGMEYPALIYASITTNVEFYNEVIVHETAHQWWYGIVGNNECEYAWIDEGLAEFSTALYYKETGDIDKYNSLVNADRTQFSTFLKSNGLLGEKCLPLNKSLESFANSTEYYYTAYVKSTLMFESLYNYLGDEKFKKALKKIAEDYAFREVTPDDLIFAFDQATGYKTKNLFALWL